MGARLTGPDTSASESLGNLFANSLSRFGIFAWLYTTVRFAFRHTPYIPLGSMEQEAEESGSRISNVAADSESYVNDVLPEVRLGMCAITPCPFIVCCQNYKNTTV